MPQGNSISAATGFTGARCAQVVTGEFPAAIIGSATLKPCNFTRFASLRETYPGPPQPHT